MSEQPAASRIQVEALGEGFQARAEQWAEQLGLPLQLAEADFSLQVGEHGLQLQQLGPDAPGPVRVDFVEGGAAHRRLYGGGSGQMIAKAVGIAQGVRPRVLDATAGLGKDAFVLASHRVVVKRPRKAPCIEGPKPSHALDGKSSRYDIYPKKALKS